MVTRALAALAAVCVGLTFAPALRAETASRYTVSAQYEALAPNAGGQIAYGLRLATNDWEAGLFSNRYLTAGGLPLTGAVYDWRFAACDDSCWWQFFLQVGGGLSNAGPLTEMTWATIIPLLPIWLPTRALPYYPALRLDVTSQLVFIRYRGVAWSYPLWVGIAVSF